MAFSLTPFVAGDNLLTKLNVAWAKIASYLNAIPGTAISSGTVPQTALAKGKAQQSWHFLANKGEAGLAGANVANVDALTVLNVDGASNSSFRITGWSIHFGNATTVLAKIAGSQILVKQNGATVITIDLNSASLAVGTPLSSALGSPISVTSGQIISIDYVAGGGGAVYPCPNLKLDVTLNHVST